MPEGLDPGAPAPEAGSTPEASNLPEVLTPEVVSEGQPLPAVPEEDGPEVHIVGTAEVGARAREVGERRLSEELASKGLISRIWKGNMARDYYLSKYTSEAEGDIRQSGNLYVHEGAGRESHERAMEATLLRFESGVDELIHHDAGEKQEELGQTEQEQGIKAAITGLIREYTVGHMDAAALEEERTRVMSELARSQPELLEKGMLFADNLKAVAEQIRAQVEHGAALDDLLERTRIFIGRAETGVRTEAHFGPAQRAMEWMKEHKLGALANEGVMVSAISIAYSVGKWSARTAGGALGRAVAPGVAAGLMAGMREGKRLKEERQQHARELAQNRDFEPGAERREKFEASRYEAVASEVLAQSLFETLYEAREDGAPELRQLTAEQYEDALLQLASAVARVQRSDREGIDLISYSSATLVEEERLKLDVMIADAKIRLGQMSGSAGAELSEEIQQHGFDGALGSRVAMAGEVLQEDIESKDRVFDSMKRREVAKAAVKAALVGATVGLVAQEVGAFVRSDQQGAAEELFTHHKPDGPHQSLLRSWLGPEAEVQPPTTETAIGADRIMVAGGELSAQPDGSYTLLGSDGRTVREGLRVEGGRFDAASQTALAEAGVARVEDTFQTVTETTEAVPMSSAEYLMRNSEQLHNVRRSMWYDNDTSRVFDRNELGLWWGGSNGIDQSGNYVFNISHMTSAGSFHEGAAADARALIEQGNVRLLISATPDTQGIVYEIPFDTNGNAIITPDNPAAAFFRSENGQAVFTGRYAEVAEMAGTAPDGAEQVRILATHVGEGRGEVTGGVARSLTETHVQTTLEMPPPPAAVVDVPPVIPVTPRRGLEPTERLQRREEPEQPALPPAPEAGGGETVELEPPEPIALGPAPEPVPAPSPEPPSTQPPQPPQPPEPIPMPPVPEPPPAPEPGPEPGPTSRTAPFRVESSLNSYIHGDSGSELNVLAKALVRARSDKAIEQAVAKQGDLSPEAAEMVETRRGELAIEKSLARARSAEGVERVMEGLRGRNVVIKEGDDWLITGDGLAPFAVAAYRAKQVRLNNASQPGPAPTGGPAPSVETEQPAAAEAEIVQALAERARDAKNTTALWQIRDEAKERGLLRLELAGSGASLEPVGEAGNELEKALREASERLSSQPPVYRRAADPTMPKSEKEVSEIIRQSHSIDEFREGVLLDFGAVKSQAQLNRLMDAWQSQGRLKVNEEGKLEAVGEEGQIILFAWFGAVTRLQKQKGIQSPAQSAGGAEVMELPAPRKRRPKAA